MPMTAGPVQNALFKSRTVLVFGEISDVSASDVARRLIALDGRTGKRCADFSGGADIALRDPSWPRPGDKGQYGLTSPPVA